ncbi:exodeoxyribonuclease V subunit alpha [Propionibacterium sp.]|uniref:exodeoxyribonuclease V subunit alpha n=1 Tax=Propionibacterium sp. TaxID=1977903 RepID=UPI0039E78D59
MTTDGRVVSARGLVAEFTDARLVSAPDVHAALMLTRTCGEHDERVGLAAALAVRALRAGSVCLPLAQVRTLAAAFAHREDDAGLPLRDILDGLPWPAESEWIAALEGSALVGDERTPPNTRPLRLVDGSVYLERYWCDQESITKLLPSRCGSAADADERVLASSLDHWFGADPREIDQRNAVRTAARARTSVIAGGPGTGKTTTVARLVLTIADQFSARGRNLRIALAAPTGKAAARLGQALDIAPVHERLGMDTVHAVTLHRLLGARPGRAPRYGTGNLLPYDLVVVDEMSMVSLSLMARLLEALPAHTQLIMVGDPDQLTPVDAGAVLADICAAELPGPDPGTSAVLHLRHNFRSDHQIADLADLVRRGDPPAVLAKMQSVATGSTAGSVVGDAPLRFVDCDPALLDLTDLSRLRTRMLIQASAIHAAATRGDAQKASEVLDSHRLLCAHRTGPYGVARWSAMAERVQRGVSGHAQDWDWFVGCPLLATTNIAEIGLSNGDTGVVLQTPDGLRAAMSSGRSYPRFLLDQVETMFAMTVHKSQGSQFDSLTLILPGPDSPLLTRELLYTAITRARHSVEIIGPKESLERAVVTPARRASGLTERLRSQLTR